MVRLVLDRFGDVLLVLAVAAGAVEPTVETLEGIQPPDGAVGAHTDTHDQPCRVHGHGQRGSTARAGGLARIYLNYLAASQLNLYEIRRDLQYVIVKLKSRSCDFTAHICTGMIVYLGYTYYVNILEDAYGC